MPTCAVCENVQVAGEACDVCGKAFPAGEATPVPVEPLEGLEPTLQGPAEAPPDALPELEPTTLDPVQVVVAAMEGLEPTEAEGIPDDLPTPAGPSATCRYCGTPAPPGENFCAHCGMRLPPAAGTGGSGELLPEVHPCPQCSVPVKGTSCPACGVRVVR